MEYYANAVIPDDQLIRCFLNNDPAALQSLVYLNKDKIYQSIYSVMQDKHLANEVLQDVFVRIIDSLMAGKQIEEGKFLPWAMRVANDTCIEHLRKAKCAPVLKDERHQNAVLINYPQRDATQAIMNHDHHNEIRRMIDMLPDEEREVIVLQHYAGLSFKEIAEVMKCNINTALGRMRYALANLHRIIEKKQVAV